MQDEPEPLSGDEVEEIHLAASLGKPNPIERPEGEELYDEIRAELEDQSVQWDLAKN